VREPVRIGTRGSALALAQVALVRAALEGAGQATDVVVIETDGDRRAPDTAWGEGAFVAAIARRLLDGAIDVAVHSAKDVPTDEDPGLRIAAYLPRADPRDALVVSGDREAASLAELPRGSRVGTDSPRRTGFLRAFRPDLQVHPLHGNVDTRLRRLDAGETDALILACAGLDRLGLSHRIVERIAPERIPPAPGQGAIAVQVRADDARLMALGATIDDGPTRAAVEAERAVLLALGGGCRSPIGALATVTGEQFDLLAAVATADGSRTVRARRDGPVEARNDIVRVISQDLRAALASPPSRPRVLVARTSSQSDALAVELREAGLEPIGVPALSVVPEPPGGDLDRAAGSLQTYDRVVVTSSNGARAILAAAERVLTDLGAPAWAAIGTATAGVLEAEGITVAFQPSHADAASLAGELAVAPGERILVVRGDLAGDRLARALRARGAAVDDVIGYRTVEAPESSRPLLREALATSVDAVVLTSGSTVRGLLALADVAQDVAAIPAVCIGAETARIAARSGFHVLAISSQPTAHALAVTTARALHSPTVGSASLLEPVS
jgi:hydroxymethylbilane synthase